MVRSRIVKNAISFRLLQLNSLRLRQIRFFAKKTVNVPFMGDSITEGKLIEFSKSPGEAVEEDELVAVVETDKTSLEIRSPEKGVIEKFFRKIDENVEVNTPLFEIDTATTTKTSLKTKGTENKTEKQKEIFVKKTEKIKETNKKVEKLTDSPKVEKTERTKKVGNRNETSIPLSRMRLKIAERLKESQNTAASLTTFNQIDCSEILKMKNDYKDSFLKITGSKLGLMSPFVKASTLALNRFPEINAYFDSKNKSIIMHDFVDVSVAVAGPNGLVVPVLRNTEKMNFAQIEKEIKNFALQAKENKLKVEDMKGGTFTVSNSGVFKSLVGTPIINPPQSAVLGLYGIFDTPVALKKEVVVRPMMQVALTYDHRIVDGREAVLFLRAIKEYVEDPLRMLFY